LKLWTKSKVITLNNRYRVNRVLKGIFGSLMPEVTGVELHNEELHTLYPSLSIIKGMKLRGVFGVGHMAHIGKIRNA
jgi:hypothetical protein